MRLDYLIAGIVAVILIILALQFLPDDGSAPVDATPVEAPPPAVEPPAEPMQPIPAPVAAPVEQVMPDPLPSLHESDDQVRAEISEWALPEMVVQRDDLLARLAVVMSNAAQGNVPSRQVAFLTPAERLSVTRRGERIYLDPTSYRRYNGYVDAVTSIPPEQAAQFLIKYDALLREALGLLGDEATPADLVQAAVARIDGLPELPAEVELIQPEVMYEYADEELEALPEFEKQLLRMGPANVERLTRYAKQVMAAYRRS